jgi:hypothetical protein
VSLTISTTINATLSLVTSNNPVTITASGRVTAIFNGPGATSGRTGALR